MVQLHPSFAIQASSKAVAHALVQLHPLIIAERISDPGNATGHSLGVRATAAALSFVVQRHLLDHHLCSQEQRLPIVHLCGFPPLLLMLEKGRAA